MVILIEEGKQVFTLQRIEILEAAVTPVRMRFAIQISIDQAAGNEIAFLQVHIQPLLHVLLVRFDLGLREHRRSKQLLHHRQQFAEVLVQAMQRQYRGLVEAGPVQVRAVIFKMFIDPESIFFSGTVLQ
jgi:hypothetical protein